MFVKSLAIFIGLWSLALISNETSLIFVPHNGVSLILKKSASNVWLTFPFTMVVCIAMTGTAFFTVFKLKLSDYMQLVPKHTDIITLSNFSAHFSALVTVICFNFMVLADQLNSQAEYHTSFLNFYAGMLKTPFLGDKLNYILPAGILVFSIIYVVISVMGYEAAVVKVIRQGKLTQNKPIKQ